MYWDQLTSKQIAALDKTIPVIFPISATEQHGYHLPLATDRMIGEHFCAHLHNRLTTEVLVLPIISVGCSEHHTDFAGSLSVQHLTMLHQMTDIATCVVQYGFKNLLILNSHGGNQAIAQTFVETFGFRNPEANIACASWWKLAGNNLKELQESGPGGVGHAAEFETSLMLIIAPDLVHLDQIEPMANTSTYQWAEGDLIKGAPVSLYRRFNEMTPNGVFGDPTLASKDKGERITKCVVDDLEKIVCEFKKGIE